MHPRELAVWIARYKLSPWGVRREDDRFAMLMHLVASAAGGKPNMKDLYPYSLEEPDPHEGRDRVISMMNWLSGSKVGKKGRGDVGT